MKQNINLENNNKIEINISNKEYVKLKNTINSLKCKYNDIINDLHEMENRNSMTFDFEEFINEVIKEKNIVVNIIKDVLNIYKEELENIECVFLSGSYARNTNKLSSDLDLHIFYKNGIFDFKYEEIISYIISRIMNKSRDCIDPTFILNFNLEYKKKVTLVMTNKKMNIIIKSKHNFIRYSYREGKKRRFFLQYNNSRKIEDLKQYIIKIIKEKNPEWCHCFNVLYGEKCFQKVYKTIRIEENKQLDLTTILYRIEKLESELKSFNIVIETKKISVIKYNYQSIVFEKIYEYISIVRIFLLHKKIDIPYIDLYKMYNVVKSVNYAISMIIVEIYKYMWILRKLTIYCYDNDINYGLHNNALINYDTTDLNKEWKILKESLIKSLNEMRNEI